MHALIVTAHPEPQSLTHGIAARIGAGLAEAGHDFEIADLAAEGFDPRFTAGDLAVHRRKAARPADVAAEQARIDRADALVLVYLVYWWSMLALHRGYAASGDKTPLKAAAREATGMVERHLQDIRGISGGIASES